MAKAKAMIMTQPKGMVSYVGPWTVGKAVLEHSEKAYSKDVTC